MAVTADGFCEGAVTWRSSSSLPPPGPEFLDATALWTIGIDKSVAAKTSTAKINVWLKSGFFCTQKADR